MRIKKPIVLIGICTSVLIIGISLVLVNVINHSQTPAQNPGGMKTYDLDDRFDWLEVYFAKEGWEIIENTDYIYRDGVDAVEILKNNNINLQIIDDFKEKILLKRDVEYVEYMNTVYKSFESRNFGEDQMWFNQNKEVTFWHTNSGNVYIYTNKSSNVHGIFITPLYYGRTTEEQIQIQDLINRHREMFGEPQFTFIDNLYEVNGVRGYKIDFYPDIGVAFTRDTIFLYNPVKENLKEFVVIIGIDYMRQKLGCTYCMYVEVIE